MPAPTGNKNAVGNKGGRPRREITPRDVKTARLLAMGGATDDQIRQALQMGKATFIKWRSKYVEFRSAIKEGGEAVDDRVERILYELAIGFHLDTERTTVKKDAEGKIVETTIVRERHFIPPSFPAVSRWLANRKRKQWAGGTETEKQVTLLELVMMSYRVDGGMPKPRGLELQPNEESLRGARSAGRC
jgi:hypothetical protein